MEPKDRHDFRGQQRVVRDYSDKEWSFTDCLSKVVMERLAIRTAFAFDQLFRQFGIVSVAP